MKSLCVVVPFYNEARTLPELIRELSRQSQSIVDQYVFVDDGSTDGSYEIVEENIREIKSKTILVKKQNGGKADAILSAIPFIQTSHLVILDADLELAVQDIQLLWQPVASMKTDYVFGFRVFRSHSSFTWRYSVGNKIISNIYGVLFNEVVSDIMCGFKLFPTNFLRESKMKYSRFSVEVEIPMRLWKQNIRAYEVEVQYRPRSRAEGKTISSLDALFVIISMIRFRCLNRRHKSKEI